VSGISPLVADLTRQWKLSPGPGGAIKLGETASICRWRHMTEEIADGNLPANTLVFMRSESESCRHRGRISEQAPARRGHFGLLPQGAYGRWTFPKASLVAHEVMHIYFPSDHLDALAERQGEGRRIEIEDRLTLIDQCLTPLVRAVDAAFDQPMVDRLYLDGLVTAIAARLISTHSVGAKRRPERGGLAPWQLKRACEALDARIDGSIGLIELADIVGLSPTHFSRAFKQSTGLAPFHWLNERRIDKARDLLLNPRIPLAEVALAVGFSAQPHFTTAFRRATGTTPGAWRRARGN
jgi:AraC-like DNA-binding protein